MIPTLIKHIKVSKTALLSGLVALLMVTGTVAVTTTLASSEQAQETGNLDVAAAEATEQRMTSEDMLATPPPLPSPAPADDQASAPVESANQSVEDPDTSPDSGTPLKDKVKIHQPRLRVTGLADPADVRRIRRMKGVRYATAFEVGTVTVGDSPTEVSVAAVDPLEFRRVTPNVTADAVDVWQRIVEGDAAFTHDTGNRLRTTLQAELGDSVPAGTEGYALRVGAYASNGIPPVADALVTRETAQALGLRGSNEVLVVPRDDAGPKKLARRIRKATGARVRVIDEPQQRRAFLTGANARNSFEPFTYIDMGDGMIQIDPAWVRRNIVRRPMPLLKGEVVCHRLMVDQLYNALKEIEDRGLGHLIDPSQYGGCWVPRHIDFNPAKPLSMHGWGLAADFNVSTNGLGQKPQMDKRIVEVFDRWGFVWGGRWSRPDGMHFELGALIRNSPQG